MSIACQSLEEIVQYHNRQKPSNLGPFQNTAYSFFHTCFQLLRWIYEICFTYEIAKAMKYAEAYNLGFILFHILFYTKYFIIN